MVKAFMFFSCSMGFFFPGPGPTGLYGGRGGFLPLSSHQRLYISRIHAKFSELSEFLGQGIRFSATSFVLVAF
jgi:hypothetical protein